MTIKNIFIATSAALLIIIILLTPGQVFGQSVRLQNQLAQQVEGDEEELRGEVREEIRLRIQQNKALREQMQLELKQRLEQKRATREAKLNQLRQDRIKRYFDRLTTRIEATIERLYLLTARIEKRVEVLEESGEADLTDVKADIEEAKELLLEAAQKLDAAKANFDDVVTAEDPKTAFNLIRETVQDIKQDLIKAHKLLVQTIGKIKGLRVGQTDVSVTQIPEPTEATGSAEN